MISKRTANILFILALLAVYFLGVGVRRSVYNAQDAPGWNEMPFTMESALHFRHIRMLLEDGDLPAIDYEVQHPGGVRVAATYSLSDEYPLAGLLGIMPRIGSLASRVRWIGLLWFCLTIPAMAAWIAALTRSRWAGLIASAFYAVMIAAVIRSTGQEISRENFAMPLLAAHLAANVFAAGAGSRRSKLLLGALSGLLLGLAGLTWDLIQFYILVAWLLAAIRMVAKLIRGRIPPPRWHLLSELCLVLAALSLSPYQRAHGFMTSPVFLLGCGLILAQIAVLLLRRRFGDAYMPRVYRWASVFAIFAPFALLLLACGPYSEHYGHFAQLLFAKLRHANIKPADPALLGFDARIMWVPALHSATSKVLFLLFPATFLLTLPLILLLFRSIFRNGFRREQLINLIVYYLTSFIAFLLFVRFHVFLALFAAGVVAVGSYLLMRRGGWKSWVWAPLLVILFVSAARHTLSDPARWGRPAVYYREMKELIDWTSANIAGEPLAANFGVSATLLTYAGNPIVLHPKFEAKDIRDRVRNYGEILFKGDQRRLREWMEEMNTRYLVYSMGEFSDIRPEWQMRYFADALDPPAQAPARYFEYDDSGLSLFRLEWQNRKYKVFRLITSEDERRGRSLLEKARIHLQSGRLQEARDAAARALLIDPNQGQAGNILRQAGSLLDQGFGDEQGE